MHNTGGPFFWDQEPERSAVKNYALDPGRSLAVRDHGVGGGGRSPASFRVLDLLAGDCSRSDLAKQ